MKETGRTRRKTWRLVGGVGLAAGAVRRERRPVIKAILPSNLKVVCGERVVGATLGAPI